MSDTFTPKFPYKVQTFRAAGLQAKWLKTRKGTQYIAVRNPDAPAPHQREKWWMVTASMWRSMHENGIIEGFELSTIMGDMFSLPV